MSQYHMHNRYGRRDLYPMPAPAVALSPWGLSWPEFWSRVQLRLRDRGYSTGTLRIYRHILRQFSKWFYSTPERVTANAVKAYIHKLTDQHCSWSWTSSNISALRMVFDRLSGLSTCKGLATPKRPKSLPSALCRDEIWRLLSSADTARDQLLLGLMYGCGLKVGDLCTLKWSDVDCSTGELHIHHGVAAIHAPPSRIEFGDTSRTVPFPNQLAPLLEKGRRLCPPDEYIFQGNKIGTHLSTRMAEYVLRRASRFAKIDKPVCGMTLRHSYAVHLLQDGASVRYVQDALGLRSIHSAMMYQRCILPAGAQSPIEALALPIVASDDVSTGEPGHLFGPVVSEVEPPVVSNVEPPVVSNVEPAESRGLPCQTPCAPAVPVPDLPAELPFEPVNITLAEQARLFYRSLKLHVRDRFLALRAAAKLVGEDGRTAIGRS